MEAQVKSFRNFDLQKLIPSEKQFFALHVNSNVMSGAGISKGDQVIIDRQVMAKNGDIIIACLGEDLLIRRLVVEGRVPTLIGQGVPVAPLTLSSEDMVWGVVWYVLKPLD